jgi:alpha-1,3-mannosyltransferase
MASLSHRYSRLPRASQRILLFILLGLGSYLLFTLSRTQTSGVWDASSVVDRRADSTSATRHGSGGPFQWLKKTFFRPTKPAWLLAGNTIPPAYLSHTGPNLARLNRAPPRRTQRGVSRIVIPGSNPEQYETGRLPTIEEAFAKLHPLLQKIKDDNEVVPREHELGSPIFPPFLTKDQQNRFQHVRALWDEEKGEWDEVERRWMMVTVCRQVAGQSLRRPRGSILTDRYAGGLVRHVDGVGRFLGPRVLGIFALGRRVGRWQVSLEPFWRSRTSANCGSGIILSGAMRTHLLNIGVPPANIHIRTLLPPIDWEGHHRIELLADMRNAGMKPFYDSLPSGTSPDGNPWTGVIFYNDVYLGAGHVLELMHQVSDGSTCIGHQSL